LQLHQGLEADGGCARAVLLPMLESAAACAARCRCRCRYRSPPAGPARAPPGAAGPPAGPRLCSALRAVVEGTRGAREARGSMRACAWARRCSHRGARLLQAVRCRGKIGAPLERSSLVTDLAVRYLQDLQYDLYVTRLSLIESVRVAANDCLITARAAARRRAARLFLPGARQVLGPHPPQHVEVAAARRFAARSQVPGARRVLGPQPLQHVEVAAAKPAPALRSNEDALRRLADGAAPSAMTELAAPDARTHARTRAPASSRAGCCTSGPVLLPCYEGMSMGRHGHATGEPCANESRRTHAKSGYTRRALKSRAIKVSV
jgi:hypothetical protein